MVGFLIMAGKGWDQEAVEPDNSLTAWINDAVGAAQHNASREKVAGDGQTRLETHTFTLHLQNTGLQDIAAVRVKVHVIGYVVDDKGKRAPNAVLQVVEKKDLAAPVQLVQDIEAGKAEIKSVQHIHAKQGNAVTETGQFYLGYVFELFEGDRLVKAVAEGPVYEVYRASKK